jgi:nitrogen fixation NifU-like protein
MSETKLYDDLVMDHIKNARNYRRLADASHEANGSNLLCGDEMLVHVRMDADEIADVGFQCTCCGISMASASIMTDLVKGRHKEEARALIRNFVAMINGRAAGHAQPISDGWSAMLDTVIRFPARARCATLAWTTLDTALETSTAP